MKIFISYRRDDTAGRAGRLFDVLVNRFGSRNVFQDVAAIAPGADFTKQVADAIASSDAALVVIGSEWLTIQGPDGTRRLDEPGDYVRGEVDAALTAGVPVVPVLVGDAELPSADDLPGELRPLVNRQAARIRDDSWHQDVDALLRRLEGEAVVDTPRRRWPLAAAAAAVAVAAVVIGWAWTARDGDDGGGDDSSSDVPPCSRPNDSWSPVDLASSSRAEGTDGSDRSFLVTAEAADYQVQSAKTVIVLRLRLDNTTAADTADADFYVAPSDIDSLHVGGVSIGPPTCFSMVSADRNVEPGEAARLLLGFEGEYEPGASLVLETNIADIDLQVADGA